MLSESEITDASVRKAVRNRIFIDDDNGLSQHNEALISCNSIGLDTEFVRDRTFFPKPGLLQFSDGQRIWLIDPIALAESTAFKSLLSDILCNPDQIKILHSVGEDFEVLELLSGHYPTPLFDTQIAAALLGSPLQMRYEMLAENLIGVDFAGGLARNDWCKRPLPSNWTEYAAHDVIALPAMRSVLEHRLQQAGRLQWLVEDCARSVQRAGQTVNPVLRIKAATRLDNPSLAMLTRLANWRDEQARLRDLPRSFVVSDPVLVAISRQRPNTMSELHHIKGIHPGFVRRYSENLLEMINLPDEEFIRPSELLPLTADQQKSIRKIQLIVRSVAEKLNIEAPLIASRHQLTRLVQTGIADWLDGWRGDILEGALDHWISA